MAPNWGSPERIPDTETWLYAHGPAAAPARDDEAVTRAQIGVEDELPFPGAVKLVGGE